MGKWDRYAEEFNNSAMGRYAAWKADTASTTFGTLDRYQPANDNYPRVIALSGVAGSGKSTAGGLLESRGYKCVKFAGPLKRMVRALGLGDEAVEGNMKESPLDMLGGHSPRHAMQTLGTAWGRECMGEDFWVNLWRRDVEATLFNAPVYVDDCRFANEASAVRSLGGVVIKLEGRGGIIGSHTSEALDFIADAVVPNTGSVAQLHNLLDSTLLEWANP